MRELVVAMRAALDQVDAAMDDTAGGIVRAILRHPAVVIDVLPEEWAVALLVPEEPT